MDRPNQGAQGQLVQGGDCRQRQRPQLKVVIAMLQDGQRELLCDIGIPSSSCLAFRNLGDSVWSKPLALMLRSPCAVVRLLERALFTEEAQQLTSVDPIACTILTQLAGAEARISRPAARSSCCQCPNQWSGCSRRTHLMNPAFGKLSLALLQCS